MRTLVLALAAALIAAPAAAQTADPDASPDASPDATQDTAPATGPDHVISLQSPHDAAATIDRLEAALEEAGIAVMGRVDHAANAAGADLELPPTSLLIFGNPRLGTPLMQSERTIGLDLPLKALAWEDAEGRVWLSYTDPAALAARYGIDDRSEVFDRMTGALDTFAGRAVAED